MQEAVPNHPLDIPAAELRALQESDSTLGGTRQAADGEPSAQSGFLWQNGLLYRRWQPAGQPPVCGTARPAADLPANCPTACPHHSSCRPSRARQDHPADPPPVLLADAVQGCGRLCPQLPRVPEGRESESTESTAHPIAGHWYSIREDGHGHCGPPPSQPVWQSLRAGGVRLCHKVPRGGTVPMRSIDAELVAEELVKFFAHVGIPREILTDQVTSGLTSSLKSTISYRYTPSAQRPTTRRPTGSWSISTRCSSPCSKTLRQTQIRIGISCSNTFFSLTGRCHSTYSRRPGRPARVPPRAWCLMSWLCETS